MKSINQLNHIIFTLNSSKIASARNAGDPGSIPGLGRSPGEGNGNPLQYTCLEVVDGIGPSATALMRRLDALTDPERVEEANMLAAWREKYMNEITARTKRRWWRRLVEKSRPGKARKRAA